MKRGLQVLVSAIFIYLGFGCDPASAQGVDVTTNGKKNQGNESVAASSEKKSSPPRWLEEKPRGLYNNTSFAIISGRGNLFSGMQTIFGYKFNPYLGIGGGIGIERFTNLPTYSYYTANFTLMPVFAEVRYTILKTRVSPVIALQGGYKWLINTPSSQMDEWMECVFPPYAWNYFYNYDTYKRGGFFAAAEIGVNAKVYGRFGIYSCISYSIWSVSGDNHYWIYNYTSFGPGEVSYIATENISHVLAYQQIFLFRLGFSF